MSERYKFKITERARIPYGPNRRCLYRLVFPEGATVDFVKKEVSLLFEDLTGAFAPHPVVAYIHTSDQKIKNNQNWKWRIIFAPGGKWGNDSDGVDISKYEVTVTCQNPVTLELWENG